MDRLRWLGLSALLALCACADERLAEAEPALVIEPAALAFPRTYVGYPSSVELALRNLGRGTATVRLSAEPPFSIEGATTRAIPGGNSEIVKVVFAPQQAGEAGGVLLADHVREERIALEGEAIAPPDCPASSSCTSAYFDGARCVDEVLPDGIACDGGACLADAVCSGGVCVGKALACDDGDACTADACHPVHGCTSFDAGGLCPASSDPCSVPVCDSASGCGFAPAADGISCGDSDCEGSRICLQGRCVDAPTPDGAACRTGCSTGTCQGGACEQDGSGLAERWRYEIPQNRRPIFPSVVDSGGNVYWFECIDCTCEGATWCEPGLLAGDPALAPTTAEGETAMQIYPAASCELISASQAGFVRYRQPIGWGTVGGMHVQGDRLVLTVRDTFEIRSAVDGGLLGRIDLGEDVTRIDDPAPDLRNRTLSPPAGDGAGHAYAGWGRTHPVYGAEGQVVAVDVATAELRWRRHPAAVQPLAPSGPPIVDETGALFVVARRMATQTCVDCGVQGIAAFEQDGAQRWFRDLPGGVVRSTWGGLLHLGWDAALDASDGSGVEGPGGSVILSTPSGIWSTTSVLERTDPISGKSLWTADVLDGLTLRDPALTSADAVVAARADALVEVDAQGAIGSCQLADASIVRAVIGQGSWIVLGSNGAGACGPERHTVRAYDLPGLAPAREGWIAPYGSPAGDLRPRTSP